MTTVGIIARQDTSSWGEGWIQPLPSPADQGSVGMGTAGGIWGG